MSVSLTYRLITDPQRASGAYSSESEELSKNVNRSEKAFFRKTVYKYDYTSAVLHSSYPDSFQPENWEYLESTEVSVEVLYL